MGRGIRDSVPGLAFATPTPDLLLRSPKLERPSPETTGRSRKLPTVAGP